MMPWVVLGITIAIGLLISVIYTAVVFFIDGFILAGFLWLIFGLLSVGKEIYSSLFKNWAFKVRIQILNSKTVYSHLASTTMSIIKAKISAQFHYMQKFML